MVLASTLLALQSRFRELDDWFSVHIVSVYQSRLWRERTTFDVAQNYFDDINRL